LKLKVSKTLKVGLAQIAPRLGDVEANLAKHLDFVRRAKEEGVHLLCFPELSLTGYRLRDLVPQVAIRPSPEHPYFAPLLEASRDLDLVVGFVEEDRRHRFYIAAAYLSEGRVLHIHRKVYLPTYGMFDEKRFLAPGDSIQAFDTSYGRAGLLICNDLWHVSAPYLLWLDGADILIFMSASPARGLTSGGDRMDSSRVVELANQAYAVFFTDFVIHCNRVGFEDGANFGGGSTVFGPGGQLIAQAPYFEESLTTAVLDLGELRRARIRLPLLRDERKELVLKELERIWAEGDR